MPTDPLTDPSNPYHRLAVEMTGVFKRTFDHPGGSEYECRPLGDGKYELRIDFETLRISDGRLTKGIRGLFRPHVERCDPRQPYESQIDTADMLNAIRELEGSCAVLQ